MLSVTSFKAYQEGREEIVKWVREGREGGDIKLAHEVETELKVMENEAKLSKYQLRETAAKLSKYLGKKATPERKVLYDSITTALAENERKPEKNRLLESAVVANVCRAYRNDSRFPKEDLEPTKVRKAYDKHMK
jgi:hypothetical protein